MAVGLRGLGKEKGQKSEKVWCGEGEGERGEGVGPSCRGCAPQQHYRFLQTGAHLNVSCFAVRVATKIELREPSKPAFCPPNSLLMVKLLSSSFCYSLSPLSLMMCVFVGNVTEKTILAPSLL